jgi:hypothetical protein
MSNAARRDAPPEIVLPPLFFLRARALDETTRALWALAIISVPIMGAIAFVILQPGQLEG